MIYKRVSLIAVFFLFTLSIACAQFYHSIYDRYGNLRCDPTYNLESADHIALLKGFNFRLDSIYYDITYPKKAWENGIRGLVIARLELVENGSSLRCEIVKTPDPIFIDPIKTAIHKHQDIILRQCTTDSTLMFYLPFEFEIVSDSYIINLKNYGVLKIQKEYKPRKTRLLNHNAQ